MHKNKPLAGFCLVLICAGLSCKEPEITGPATPDEGNFSYPEMSFDSPTIAFTTNRPSNVVYVGETFEIKVILYCMPESLFAAGGDFVLPGAVEILGMVPNPEFIYSASATVGLSIIFDNTASYAVAYIAGNSPSTAANGVLLKLICKAISPAEVTLGASSITNLFFRITDSGMPVGPESGNEEMTPGPTVSPLSITISDEFVGG